MPNPHKPIAIRELEGNPSRRPIPQVPEPRAKAPRQPQWLSEEAAKCWQQHAKELEDLGILTSVDGPAFAALVMNYSMMIQAAKELRKKDADTKIWWGRFTKASKELRPWLTEFGLTPASRVRLGVTAHEEIDEFSEFVN